MKSSFILLPVTLLAGVGIGYFIPKSQPLSTEEELSAVNVKLGVRSSSPASASQSVSVSSAFRSAIFGEDAEEVKKMVKDLSPDERDAHIQALLDSASPEGLPYGLESVINDLLKERFKEDPAGTIAWILANGNVGNRDYLFEAVMDQKEAEEWGGENFDGLFAQAQELEHPLKILKELIGTQVEQDTIGAIALSKEHLRGTDGRIDFPSGLQSEAVKLGWEATFEYFKDSWQEGNSSSSWSGLSNVPEDFDFDSFAVSWKEHEASLGLDSHQGGFYSPPSGVWDVWTQRDPEAAFEFLISGGSRTFELDDFFDEYQDVATADELFAFSQNVLADPPEAASSMGKELTAYLADKPVNSANFSEWVQENGAYEMIPEILGELSSYNDKHNQTGADLFQLIPARDQLSVLRESFTETLDNGETRIRVSSRQREFFREMLEPFGHSAAAVDAALSK